MKQTDYGNGMRKPGNISPPVHEETGHGIDVLYFAPSHKEEEQKAGIDVLEFASGSNQGSPGDRISCSESLPQPEEKKREQGIDVLVFFPPHEEKLPDSRTGIPDTGLLPESSKSEEAIEVLEFIQRPEVQTEHNGDLVSEKIPAVGSGRTSMREESMGLAMEGQRLQRVPVIPSVPSITMAEKNGTGMSAAGCKLDIVRAEEASATNFAVIPVCVRRFYDREGKEAHEKAAIDCTLLINQGMEHMTISFKEIDSLAKRVTRRFPDAILDYEEKDAAKTLEVKFRNAIPGCRQEKVYFQAGWQLVGESPTYLRDGLNLGSGQRAETGMTLPAYPCSEEGLGDIFRKAIGIYDDPAAMSVMVSFSVMGVLFHWFQRAGYPPHFALFLHGKTGSMKTTIGKILFMQLCEEGCRDRVRRIDADTEVSLERAVVMAGHDTVTLIDDFSPAKTKGKKRAMDDKLEMVIRMVGDGSSRSRSNMKLEDRRGEGVQGMVVLTGELMGKGLSSNLRCFYCRMERERANEKTITWFQDNPYAYTTLIAAFADFVGQNNHIVTGLIRQNFSRERKALGNVLRERRLIDSAATLCLAVDILGKFLRICCRMPDKEVEEMKAQMKTGIVECAKISEALSTEESPSIAFVQAIGSLMRMNQITLNTDKVRMAEVCGYDGFADEHFWYFNPDIVHKKVVAFLHQTNHFFPFELKEVLTMLADDGIIKTAANGAGKRTLCVRIAVGRGKKLNFLKISRTVFEAICDGTYDCKGGEKE